MSQSVDVLSILDQAIERERDAGQAYVAQIAAKSAVAKLIDTVDELLSTHGEYICYGGQGESIESQMRAELVEALANVRGEGC